MLSVDFGCIVGRKKLNKFYFLPIIRERVRGLNNLEISKKLGINVNTVNKYVNSLCLFSDRELSVILVHLSIYEFSPKILDEYQKELGLFFDMYQRDKYLDVV